MSTPVTLTPTELKHAYSVGMDRWVRNQARNANPAYGASRSHQPDLLGAVGEAVVAKHLATWWTEHLGRPDHGEPDVGPFHVRTIDLHTNRLILHPDDRDDGPYVLVLVPPDDPTNCQIIGWCYGRDGKRDEFWWTATGRPAFFVPHTALNPDLTAYTNGHAPPQVLRDPVAPLPQSPPYHELTF